MGLSCLGYILTVEELFKKMRNEFGKTGEEGRKVEQLRTIEQGCHKLHLDHNSGNT